MRLFLICAFAFFLVPYGILNQAGAEVLAVAPTMEPIAFWPASSVRPDADFAGFDAKFPGGAGIVIVPATAGFVATQLEYPRN